jgi:hypothetical protein
MKLIRKLHLIAGIVMFPWVMLYAVSAFTFNHRAWFATRPAQTQTAIREGQPLVEPGIREKVVPFIMYLHRSSTYPTTFASLRWWWGFMIDAMCLTLMFWAVSGLVMWWRMGNQRVMGGITLSSCIVISALMIAGMWEPWLKDYWYKAQAKKAAAAALTLQKKL